MRTQEEQAVGGTMVHYKAAGFSPPVISSDLHVVCVLDKNRIGKWSSLFGSFFYLPGSRKRKKHLRSHNTFSLINGEGKDGKDKK